jgi:hypothetical protein
MATERDDLRCPICGRGVLKDISYARPDRETSEAILDPDSVEVFSFSCGHETRGGKLATSDYDVIDVEHRNVDRIVAPPDEEGGE